MGKYHSKIDPRASPTTTVSIATGRRTFNGPHFEDLHQRVLSAFPDAEQAVCRVLLPILRRELDRSMPAEDADAKESAIEDAIMVYLGAPSRYRPSLKGPVPWLLRIARNRTIDYRRSKWRLLLREHAIGTTLFSGQVSDCIEAQLLAAEAPSLESKRLSLFACVSLRERAFLEAWCRGDSGARLAVVLGCGDLPLQDQRTLVQRMKARLRKRAKAVTKTLSRIGARQ